MFVLLFPCRGNSRDFATTTASGTSCFYLSDIMVFKWSKHFVRIYLILFERLSDLEAVFKS